MKLLVLLSSVLFSLNLFAANNVAKAKIVKGTVKIKAPSSKSYKVLKIGSSIQEGSNIKTSAKSFARIVFTDKSQVNVGPNSEMIISSFPKDEPGVISLVEGQLRADVKKDASGEKSKLFIKTKTAAMGIRGTLLQAMFNRATQQTSLVTFRGLVAMARANPNIDFNINTLESLVSSDTAVNVREGQFSGASPNSKRVTIPVKISPAQLESLKSNTDFSGSKSSGKKKRSFRSPIPPGVEAKSFANTETSLDSQIETTATQTETDVATTSAEVSVDTPPAEGATDASGATAPPAGGYIDLATGLYVPPPEGSVFDANTGVYVPSANMGGFDMATGEYIPPEGFNLSETGEFVADTARDSSTADTADALPPRSVLSDDGTIAGEQIVTADAARTFDDGGLGLGDDAFELEFANEAEELAEEIAQSTFDDVADIPPIYLSSTTTVTIRLITE